MSLSTKRSILTARAGRALALIALLIGLLFLSPAASQTGASAPGLSLDPGSFSPNGDGVRDFLVVRPTGLRDEFLRPRDWTLEIRSGANEIVRTFAADHRRIRASRAINNLYLPGSDDLRPLALFDEIIWDGRDDEGQRVPEGVYQLTLRLQLPDNGGFVESQPAPVIVDTSAPELQVSAPISLLVRAPGSGPSLRAAGERLEIQQTARSDAGTRYDANVVGPRGTPIRERSWDDSLPERIFIYWDEIRTEADEDESIAYGDYLYRISAVDRAGNRSQAEVKDLLLAPRDLRMDLRADEYRFSPNGDGSRDQIQLRPAYINQAGNALSRSPLAATIAEHVLEVVSTDLQTVFYRKRGSGAPPESFVWDGRDDAGDILSDGLYFVRLRVTAGGESIATLNKSLWIDTAAPDADLSISRTSIRPDGDGEEEYLKLKLDFDDPSGIASWNIRVLLTPTPNARVDVVGDFRRLYRTFAGTTGTPPDEIYWDGTSDEGIPCESLEKFTIEYEVRDRAGNLARSAARKIGSGVLFRPVSRGRPALYSRLPAQNYFNESYGLTDQGEDALDEVLSRLSRYGSYEVIIENHSALPGREESNLEKTEQRARSMYEYFLKQGFPANRLKYRGHGEAELARDGRTEFASYRNERIEIRLQLPQPQTQP
ncbi:MAG: OmpA family protein [bacterium]|nr:OmpA family protein [bacterium]